MYHILLLVLGIALCNGREVFEHSESDVSTQWFNFKTQFNKNYNPIEEDQKLKVFTENLKIIRQLNAKFNPETYFAVNQFADLTLQEFKNKIHINFQKEARQPTPSNNLPTIPVSVDWRKKGVVTPITNQDQCGSSPYFAATTSIEGAWAIAGHPLEVLSVQQIIDCTQTSVYNNYGCNGGWMNESIAYAADFGLETNTSYPYTGNTGASCLADAKKVVSKVKGVVNVAATEGDITAALATVPLASAIYVTSGFQFYSSGIFNDPDCVDQPEHGIGIVGYGQDDKGVKFFILKNWWTTTWGEEGYMRIIRNGKNNCGLFDDVSYAVV